MNNSNEIEEASCLNPHIISTDSIYKFTEVTDYVLFFGSLISSILQIYVIRSALSHIRRRASDECLHLFLLSMTFGDLILTLVCYPLEFISRSGLFGDLPFALNISQHFLTWVALSGSSISLILLNLDKLLYFKYPLRYSSYVTRSKGISIVVSVWTGCTIFVLAAWLYGCFRCVDEHCNTLGLFSGKTAMYVFFTISVCVIPTLTSLGVALYILKVVSQHKRQLAEEQILCGNSSTVPHAISSRLRTFYFIFMTTIFTACTLLPYRIIGIKRALSPEEEKECVTILILWIMMYLINLNAILNPIITITVLPQYRARIIRKFLGLEHDSEAKTKTAADV